MSSILVSLGTDGATSWVQRSDGQKFNLGSLSVLSFVTKLAKNTAIAKKVLQEFLEHGESLLSVNEEHMWALLQPPVSRWASDSFMVPDQQQETVKMSTLETLTRIEQKLQYLNRLATQGEQAPEVFGHLKRLASTLDAAVIAAENEDLEEEEEDTSSKTASAVHAANLDRAQSILTLARETISTIDARVAEGRKFNATRARADVYAVTAKAGSLCEQTQLVESWVTKDLHKLSSEMVRIHGLFHPQA